LDKIFANSLATLGFSATDNTRLAINRLYTAYGNLIFRLARQMADASCTFRVQGNISSIRFEKTKEKQTFPLSFFGLFCFPDLAPEIDRHLLVRSPLLLSHDLVLGSGL